MARVEVKQSGPINVAEFDCYGCERGGLSTLLDSRCRSCVLGQLAVAEEVDQVVLKGAYHHIYPSRELSKLAKALGMAEQQLAGLPRARREAAREALGYLRANPHDLKIFDELGMEEMGRIKAHLKATIEPLGLTHDNYDRVFDARVKPFFIAGIWRRSNYPLKLKTSYELEGGRGRVRIYEQIGSPMLFYELDLPEFRLFPREVELLYEAFRLELREAPEHARFAHADRRRAFSEDLYYGLMNMLAAGEFSVGELRKLARYMANWLSYGALEPLARDDSLTDIHITAPPEHQPITVEHELWGRLDTGIYLSTPDLFGFAESAATREGKPFDEPHPQLDAEIPELGLRLFLSRYPAIYARSVEMAVRKRRSKPWTQPLFLERGTLTPLASSFLSNTLRIGASASITGGVSTAKTSQVETYVPEIGKESRIIAFQDTEELHIDDFAKYGYRITNVRVKDPAQLQKQVEAFLRGGAAHWLITEARDERAVRSALGAAARQGGQPVTMSFHARSKQELFDLICHTMGLDEAAFKYVDFIISTARFSTPAGTIRRVVEIAEVLKEWEGKPEYAEIFVDDRKRDSLLPKNFLRGEDKLINELNSYDLSKVNVVKATKQLEFVPPEDGGSWVIPFACKKLALNEGDLLMGILAEARMKSDLLSLARSRGDLGYLELPFVSAAYDVYFSLLKSHERDYWRVMEDWVMWLKSV